MKIRIKNPIAKAVHKVKRAKAKLSAQKTTLEQELQIESGDKIILACDVWTNMAKGVSELDNCKATKVSKPSEDKSCVVIEEKSF
jgi:hypothetical protein